MINVVGITFKDRGRVYFFDANGIEVNLNENVIVETERGFQFGKVEILSTEKNKQNLSLPLKRVIIKATLADIEKSEENTKEAKRAFIECERLIKKYNLNMKLMDATFTFDREQLLFHFLSESRIDFRELAKALASMFKTRIELRQVGVRDKAKEIGGLGPCGRSLCCTDFLVNFDSVSINMAKNQNLSLNPNKINGSCGRLLCCLTYENETYEEYKKELPSIGEKLKYKGKEGRVVEVDVLNRSYKILTNDEEYIKIERE